MPVVITLPDGSQRCFESPVTVADVAAAIGPGLARAALAGRVDGKLVDTSHLIERDASVAIITAKDPEGLEILRHSTAHLLAQAVQSVYPEAQVTIGPVIEDGFYYDFAFKRPFTPEDLAKFEAKMHELAQANLPVSRRVMPRNEAVDVFRRLGEHYKAEIIASIPANEDISLYGQGDWFDLCRGPHVPGTGKLGAFKLMKVAGAYWRGDKRNEMLQRIYGTAWPTRSSLKAYLTRLEEAEKRDHRRIGREMGLFHTAGRGGRQRVLASQGLDAVSHARATCASGWRPAMWRCKTPQLVDRVLWEQSGPLGELRAQHVHRRVRGPDARAEADELPLPRADLPAGHQVATATCRCAWPSSVPAIATSRRARCTGSCACARSRRTTRTSSAREDQITRDGLRSATCCSIYKDLGFTDVRSSSRTGRGARRLRRDSGTRPRRRWEACAAAGLDTS
jgi:hypothetical protein